VDTVGTILIVADFDERRRGNERGRGESAHRAQLHIKWIISHCTQIIERVTCLNEEDRFVTSHCTNESHTCGCRAGSVCVAVHCVALPNFKEGTATNVLSFHEHMYLIETLHESDVGHGEHTRACVGDLWLERWIALGTLNLHCDKRRDVSTRSVQRRVHYRKTQFVAAVESEGAYCTDHMSELVMCGSVGSDSSSTRTLAPTVTWIHFVYYPQVLRCVLLVFSHL
jgi:hypothetical protein